VLVEGRLNGGSPFTGPVEKQKGEPAGRGSAPSPLLED
jgi:hypothetical protein